MLGNIQNLIKGVHACVYVCDLEQIYCLFIHVF